MPKRSPRPAPASPTFREEAALSRRGYELVGGVDEVGRGPLAGPVVAGVAILPARLRGPRARLVRDSKQLRPAQRREALSYLRRVALVLSTGISSSQEVDQLGIVEATHLAMRRALWSMPLLPQFLLIDALTLPDVSIPQKAVVHGDALCRSIAAASIVAKVTRDEIMAREDETYPGYGFARHKGYGTREHMEELQRLGPCAIHRRSFAPVRTMLGEGQ